MATSWESVTDQDGVCARFAAGAFDINRPLVEPSALVHGSVTPSLVPVSPSTGGAAAKVDVIRDSLNQIVLQAAPTGPSLLMIDDAWFPGWRATVDGKEEPIYCADVMFRGLFLTPGNHVVQLDFFPNYLVAGCLMGVVGLGLTLFLLIGGCFSLRPR
jgi:hypothetical protein